MLQLFRLFLQHVPGGRANLNDFNLWPPQRGRTGLVFCRAPLWMLRTETKNFCILFQTDFKSDTIKANFLLFTNY